MSSVAIAPNVSRGQDIGGMIVSSSDLCGGQPRLAGTGVSVRRVAGWYRLGLSPEEIAEEMGGLNLAQVHAALAYYHANRADIEAALAREEEAAMGALSQPNPVAVL